MSILDTDSAKTLLDSIRNNLEKTLQNQFIDFNNENTKNAVKEMFRSCTDSSSIDVRVEECTWESLYPFMPERLLAIEAYELFDDTIRGELPSECVGYPYIKDIKTVLLREKTEKHNVDLSLYEIWHETEACIFIKGTFYGPSDCVDDVHVKHVLPTPYTLMDLYFKPAMPVKYITFECVITPYSLEDSIDE